MNPIPAYSRISRIIACRRKILDNPSGEKRHVSAHQTTDLKLVLSIIDQSFFILIGFCFWLITTNYSRVPQKVHCLFWKYSERKIEYYFEIIHLHYVVISFKWSYEHHWFRYILVLLKSRKSMYLTCSWQHTDVFIFGICQCFNFAVSAKIANISKNSYRKISFMWHYIYIWYFCYPQVR